MSDTTTRGVVVSRKVWSQRIVVSEEGRGLVLHLLGDLVRVEDAWHRHLHLPLLLLRGLQGGLKEVCLEVSRGLSSLEKSGGILIVSYLPLLQVQIGVVLASKLPDLY